MDPGGLSPQLVLVPTIEKKNNNKKNTIQSKKKISAIHLEIFFLSSNKRTNHQGAFSHS